MVRVLNSHAAALGSIPGSGIETPSKFPKILFLIEELLSMLHVLIAKCLLCIKVLYTLAFPHPGRGKVNPCRGR